MEPTIYLSISIYSFILVTMLFLIPSINTISYFKAQCLEKRKNRGRDGYSSKSHLEFLFYTLEESVLLLID